MTPDEEKAWRARQEANRRAHPIWRGMFVYSIVCNQTIIWTLMLTGRELEFDLYPILTRLVVGIYLFSEVLLLFVSPFFIRRFGTLATLGLVLALFNFLLFSISGRT